jgi:hypothetical protein
VNSPAYALFDRAGIAQQIFFPRPDPSTPPPGATDLLVALADGTKLGARWYRAPGSTGTVLYFHGNGEVASDHDGIARFYHQVGLDLLVVEFRGYGRSTGRPSFAALVDDGGQVAAWFHALLDSEATSGRRYVMGRSLGSHPALEIAANAADGLSGVIIESGAAMIRRLASRLVGGAVQTDELEALIAAHEAKLRRIALPVLILHGQWDELVPFSQAEALHGLLPPGQSRLVPIPGAGHNDILYAGLEQYFAAIAEFTS